MRDLRLESILDLMLRRSGMTSSLAERLLFGFEPRASERGRPSQGSLLSTNERLA